MMIVAHVYPYYRCTYIIPSLKTLTTAALLMYTTESTARLLRRDLATPP